MSKMNVHKTAGELAAATNELLTKIRETKKTVQGHATHLRTVEETIRANERREQEAAKAAAEAQAAQARQEAAAQESAAPIHTAAVESQPAPVRETEPVAKPAAPEEAPAASHSEAQEASRLRRQPRPVDSQDGGRVAPRDSQRAPYSRDGQGSGQRAPYNRDGQRAPYSRDSQGSGQRAPYSRDGQGSGQRAPYSRDGQGSGQRAPYSRDGQGGQRAPHSRDVQGGQRAPYSRDGQRPAGPRPGFGRDRVPDKDAEPARQGQQRRTGGAARGGISSRALAKELVPSLEKERVSNYDPKKNSYKREPEKDAAKKNKKALQREMAPAITGDDEYVRGGRRPKRRQVEAPVPEKKVIDHAVITTERVAIKDLAEKIGKPGAAIIKKLMLLGTLANINQEIDFDMAELVAADFGVTLEHKVDKTAEETMIDAYSEGDDDSESLIERPPVVTIMGHVDHGKTSLLDAIRNTRVTAGEAGGITQHIGAYSITVRGDKRITFLDTPGHEAFTAMRARGAQVTDVAVLVVAADDGIMPQTVEAINHIKDAKVPMIVAINKMDLATANPDRILQELTQYGIVAEEWGGDAIIAKVSATTGEGLDNLLDMILLVSEVEELRANPNRRAKGTVVEAKMDNRGRGPVATVLVQNGTLRVGDYIVAGGSSGRVRAMNDDMGRRVQKAGPSIPVEVVGFSDVPEAGDVLYAVEDEKLSKRVASERREKIKADKMRASSRVTLDDLFDRISQGNMKELRIIIKADVQGSAEAVRASLEKLSNDEVRIVAIHSGVGAITESDVMLASSSNAVIIGFNIRPDANGRAAAERENVEIRTYRVIYNAIEDMEKAIKGMLDPTFKEVVHGHAEVRTTFNISNVGTVAGCYVTDGKILRNDMVRVTRDSVVIHEGKLLTLKRFKDDVREVASGYECGVSLENFNDIKENDVIEAYAMEEVTAE